MAAIEVVERGRPIAFSFDDMLRYHGGGSPGAWPTPSRFSSGRYRIDESLARPERGRTFERFVFRLSYRDRSVMLELREGFVTEECIDLARTEGRSPEQERRLDILKQEMADRVMAPGPGGLHTGYAPVTSIKARATKHMVAAKPNSTANSAPAYDQASDGSRLSGSRPFASQRATSSRCRRLSEAAPHAA